MTGHSPFCELTDGFSAQGKARVADKVATLRQQMTQENIAAVAKPPRQFGAFAGKFSIGPKFFEPMSKEDREA